MWSWRLRLRLASTTFQIGLGELSCGQSASFPSSDQQCSKGLFVGGERLPAALVKHAQFLEVRLQQVGRHFRLLERVVDADSLDFVKQNEPQLLHRCRVYVQRLLQK